MGENFESTALGVESVLRKRLGREATRRNEIEADLLQFTERLLLTPSHDDGWFAHALAFSIAVGYLGKTANAKGNTMIAPSFLGIDSTTGCTLADLTVTGYEKPTLNEDDEYDGGCCGGEFALTFLTSSGTLESRYYWIDDGDNAPGWYADQLGEPIAGGASAVAIDAGRAVWVYGSGYTLQTAGKVNTKDIAVKMNSKGNTACGNGMPIDLTLGKLTVSGYDAPTPNEDDEYDGGCSGGQFALTFLTSSGRLEARYYWIDDGDNNPDWYADQLGESIEGGSSSVKFTAGQGVWVYGSGMILNVPAPEL